MTDFAIVSYTSTAEFLTIFNGSYTKGVPCLSKMK